MQTLEDQALQLLRKMSAVRYAWRKKNDVEMITSAMPEKIAQWYFSVLCHGLTYDPFDVILEVLLLQS